jgi:hypothetical protein
MSHILTDVQFWAIVGEIGKRTIICPPDLESRVKGYYIDARGLGGLLKVQASPACPDGKIFVIDEEAAKAELNRQINGWQWW